MGRLGDWNDRADNFLMGDEPVEPYPHHELTPVLAGIIGATIAVLSGRPRTRIDNFFVGGLFTAFAAYRDPRASVVGTLAVAAVEGAIWGVTDRIVPEIKEWLLPSGHEEPVDVPSPLVTA